MAIYKRDYEDEDNEIVVDPNAPTEKNKGQEAHEDENLNWKSRYSNLRSHSQKQINTLEKKVDALTKQVNQPQVNLPKTKEEVENWSKKYPEPYAFVKSIIGMDLGSVTEDVSSRFDELQAREAANHKERAEMQLEKLHPDFFSTIMPSVEFKDWLDGKSKRMQDALYEDDDPIAASEVISLYKAEKGIRTKKSAQKNNAADDIPSRSSVSPNDGSVDYEFTESQIQAMTGKQYDDNEAAIEKAQRDGRILYDMTGAAR